MVAGLVVAATWTAAVPKPAHAIFGIGDIVYDPANHANSILRYGQLILQANQMARQVVVATRQANHAIQQARGFSIGTLRIPSLGTILDRIDGRYGSGETLGYGNSQVDRLFRRTFPRVAEWNHRAAGNQAAAAREAAFNVLLSARDHHLQLDQSQRRLDDLKLQLAAASTDREVAQIQNRIAAEQLDQQLLQRNLEMGTANMQAVDVAMRADQAARTAMEDTAGAVYSSYQQSVHEAAGRRVEARQDSIVRARAGRQRTTTRP
ncbi:MAG TPA: type IV secretion system protein [Longimicrobium sp.]|nr:type IV secretion system protein [Longimicrobium sp.]